MNYGIYHKSTKSWFTGFDSNDHSTWGTKTEASTYSKLHAQAQLLYMFDNKVQRKPKFI